MPSVQSVELRGWRVGNGAVEALRRRWWNIFLVVTAVSLSGCATFKASTWRGDGKVLTSEHGTCVLLSPENAQHPVSACEMAGRYDVEVVGRRYAYSQAAFQAAVRERLWQYLRHTAYPVEMLRAARIDVWLSAPVFTPEEAAFVAVVVGSFGENLAVRLPLAMGEWRIRDEDVSALGTATTPNTRARAVGLLLVKPTPSQTEASFRRFLEDAGRMPLAVRGQSRQWAGGKAVREVWPVAELDVEPFTEAEVTRLLASTPGAKVTISAVERQGAPEPEGYKAKAFSFFFAP